MYFNVIIYLLLVNCACGLQILSLLKKGDELSLKNVNDECKKQMNATINGLINSEEWALSMIDASSRIPNGLLSGNLIDFGNFDQCLRIKQETPEITIKGKHCTMGRIITFNEDTHKYDPHFSTQKSRIKFFDQRTLREAQESNLGLYLSMCIPDSCEPNEIQEYFNISSGAIFNNEMCQTNNPPEYDGGDIAAITFLSFVLLLMIASTLYDAYLHQQHLDARNPNYLAFSVLTNGKKLFKVNKNQNQINCVNGIRFISMMWVVAGHRFATIGELPSINTIDVLSWMNKLYSQYIQSAYVAVDTFFFLSGMMISYGYFKGVHKPRPKTFIPIYYFHRFLRITPAVAMVFFVSATILQYIGQGPLSPLLTQFSRDPCLKWWWSYFLYIQNYVNYDEMCVVPTWYLSADMQMFLLSPLLLLPLGYVTVKKSRDFTYKLCVCIIGIFTLVPFIISFFIETENIYMTHDRLAVWMVGFTVGIVLEDVKSNKLKVKIDPMLNLLVWLIVLSGMIAILLTMHDVTYNPTVPKTNIFTTYHRLGWGIGMGWIIYSCTIGYGGFVNSFLSCTFFQMMSRLTYSMYLVHYMVILLSVVRERRPFYFTDYAVFYTWCGDILCTIILAFAWVLAFESPVLVLEKLIFGNGGKSEKKSIRNGQTEEITTLPKV